VFSTIMRDMMVMVRRFDLHWAMVNASSEDAFNGCVGSCVGVGDSDGDSDRYRDDGVGNGRWGLGMVVGMMMIMVMETGNGDEGE